MRTASRCKKRSSCWWSDFSLCSKGGSCDAAPVSGVPASRSTSVLPRKIYSRKLTQPHGFMSQRHAPPRGLRNALRLPRPWLNRLGCRPETALDTWLILPVVICLSQRLSHASTSISNLYGETADGSLKQSQFMRWTKSHGYLW